MKYCIQISNIQSVPDCADRGGGNEELRPETSRHSRLCLVATVGDREESAAGVSNMAREMLPKNSSLLSINLFCFFYVTLVFLCVPTKGKI